MVYFGLFCPSVIGEDFDLVLEQLTTFSRFSSHLVMCSPSLSILITLGAHVSNFPLLLPHHHLSQSSAIWINPGYALGAEVVRIGPSESLCSREAESQRLNGSLSRAQEEGVGAYR